MVVGRKVCPRSSRRSANPRSARMNRTAVVEVGGEQHCPRAVAVLASGGADRDGEEQAEGVGDDEPLAAVDLFPAS
jgi:hypothetical protein